MMHGAKQTHPQLQGNTFTLRTPSLWKAQQDGEQHDLALEGAR